MTQNERDKRAILTILSQMGDATYPDIALRGGEGLGSPLIELVLSGEVERFQIESANPARRTFYRLVSHEAKSVSN